MAHPSTHPATSDKAQATELDALVIGAGFAGLYQLLCLRDRLGLKVKTLEAGSGVGGTCTGTATPAPAATPKATRIGTPSIPN